MGNGPPVLLPRLPVDDPRLTQRRARLKGTPTNANASGSAPADDRLAGSHAHSRRRVLPLRRLHLSLVVTQLGVGFDLVEARVFKGPL